MQRYFGIRKEKNNLILDKQDYHHIKNVMRMNDGDLIEVIVNQKLYIGCIENVKSNIEVNIKKELDLPINNFPKVNLIVPLLKENKMDLILQKATEMGTSKIIIYPFKRCMVKVNSKIENKLSRWKKILKEASEQSFRNDIPEVVLLKNLEHLKKINGLKLICSTKKISNNLKMVLTEYKNCDTINIVIGPEGGIDPIEEDYLNSIGYISITLGNRIMRVESVPLFLLSIINYEYME